MKVQVKRIALACVLMFIGPSFMIIPASGGTRTPDNDNNFAHSTSLSNGVMVTGNVNANDDPSDFYSIYASSGQVMTTVFKDTGPYNMIVINVYDPDQNYLGSTDRSFSLILAKDGTYDIEVHTTSGYDSYQLTVSWSVPSQIVPGYQTSAYLDSSNPFQMDAYYRIWLYNNLSHDGQTEGVWINMTEWSGTNFDLYVYDIYNKQKCENYNSSRDLSPYEQISFAASYSGWYYIYVYAYQGAGDITLDCTRFSTKSDGNDDVQNALFVKHNGIVSESVDEGWDHYDWYQYHVLQGDYLNVQVDRNSGSDVFNVSMYDTNMNYIIGKSNYVSGGISGSASVPFGPALSDTTYYVGVSAIIAFRGGSFTDDTAYVPYKITFTSTNHAPQILASFDDIIIDEDTVAFIPISTHFKDPDGDSLSITGSGQINITVFDNVTSNNIELIPASNWYGFETIMIMANDGWFGLVSLTLNITVRSVNDAPFLKQLIPDIHMLQGGNDSTIDLSTIFYDYDIPYGDMLSYSVNDNGTIWVDITPDGKVTLTDPIDFYGQVTMKFIATDNYDTTAIAFTNVIVQHVNQPPRVVRQPENITMNEDTAAQSDMSKTFRDVDGDPITLIANGQTKLTVSIDPNTLMVTFRPGPNLSGFFEDIKFTAKDDKGLGDFFVVVRVTVVPINDPPTIQSYVPNGEMTIDETEKQDFSVTAKDIDSGGILNYTWSLDGSDLGINDASYLYITDYHSAGIHVIRVVVDDGELSVSHIWNVTVSNKNQAPTDVRITNPQNGTSFRQGLDIELKASARDEDNDILTFRWMDGQKTIGTGKNLTTSFQITGLHKIGLEISDGTASVYANTIFLTINANNPPTLISYSPGNGGRFEKGKNILFNAAATDADQDILSYQWLEGGNILSTQQSFTISTLTIGNHVIILSISDYYSTTNQTIGIEITEPIEKNGGNTINYAFLGGALFIVIIIIGVVSVIIMRKKKNITVSKTTASPHPTPYVPSIQPPPQPPIPVAQIIQPQPSAQTSIKPQDRSMEYPHPPASPSFSQNIYASGPFVPVTSQTMAQSRITTPAPAIPIIKSQMQTLDHDFAVEDVFLMFNDGRLIQHTTRRIKADMDLDVMTSMLKAVQDFVKESIGKGEGGELGSMEYGENKIILQKGKYVILAVVISGTEPHGFRNEICDSISNVEGEYAAILKFWDGDTSKLAGSKKFLARLGSYKPPAIAQGQEQSTTDISLMSELEFYHGFIRLKVAIKNNSPTVITKTSFRLIYNEDVLRFDSIEPDYPKRGEEIFLDSLDPREKRTIAFYLDPQICTESYIDGNLTFKDGTGNFRSLTLPRKLASVVCPLIYTEENINTAMMKRMIDGELDKKDSKLFAIPVGLSTQNAFEIGKSSIQNHDVRLIREFIEQNPYVAEAWYYGKAKGREDKLIIRARVIEEKQVLEFFVACSSTLMLTGLLAELKSDLKKTMDARRAQSRMIQITENKTLSAISDIRTLLDKTMDSERTVGETEQKRNQ